MENLILSFKVVAPLIILMLLGAFMLRVHIFDDATVKKMNTAVFKVFLPALIFYNIYNSSIEDIKDIRAALYASIVLMSAFALCSVLICFIEKDARKRGVMVQGMCRSNFVIFGVPLCVSLCGDEILGKISVAVTIIIPVINILSVVVLEVFRGAKPSAKKILKGIITNPLTIASALGMIALVSGIKLGSVLTNALGDVSKIATPLALILLGASIDLKKVRGNLGQLFITVFGKLVAVPFIGIFIAVLMGMRNGDLALLIAALAAPTAVSSYPMALSMDGDGELAAQIVAFGTVLCIVTVFLWVFVLKQLGLI